MNAVPGVVPHTGALVATASAAALSAGAQTGNNSQRRSSGAGVLVKALSTNAVKVYVGGSDVTGANGIELAAGESVTLPVDDPGKVYIIAPSGSPEVRYLYL